MIATETPMPGSLHPACSTESDMWHEYLLSCAHTSYDGCCKCYRCQDVRNGFKKWKSERGPMLKPHNVPDQGRRGSDSKQP